MTGVFLPVRNAMLSDEECKNKHTNKQTTKKRDLLIICTLALSNVSCSKKKKPKKKGKKEIVLSPL